MKSFALIASAFAAEQALASKVFRGCQEPTVQQQFDLDAYLGLWYEQRRDKECSYEDGICNTAQYSLTDDPDTIRVRNNELDDGVWGGGTGKAFVVDPSKDEGYLKVKFVPLVPAGDYKIMETDYTNYTVLYTCTGFLGAYSVEYVWILTREPEPSDDVMNKALDVVRTKVPKYDMSALAATHQGDDCPYDSQPNGHPTEIGWIANYRQE